MVSGSGLWDQNIGTTTMDARALPIRAISLRRSRRARRSERRAAARVSARVAARSQGIPWFPVPRRRRLQQPRQRMRFARPVRADGGHQRGDARGHPKRSELAIPRGLWCYRVDRRRFVIGGALSNGGDVYAWMKRNLVASRRIEALDEMLAAMVPGTHGLTMLPFLCGRTLALLARRSASRDHRPGPGNRARGYRARVARIGGAAVSRRSTACLRARLGEPAEVIASGGALLHSRAWTQMMADALGRPVISAAKRKLPAAAPLCWRSSASGLSRTSASGRRAWPKAISRCASHEAVYDTDLRPAEATLHEIYGNRPAHNLAVGRPHQAAADGCRWRPHRRQAVSTFPAPDGSIFETKASIRRTASLCSGSPGTASRPG